VTESFEVMDMNKDDINIDELKRLVVTLNWLCNLDKSANL